ncbi:MAG: hypothetical protein WC553_01285 [Patescibacteria group bacterium]
MKKELLILQSYILTFGVIFAGYNTVLIAQRYLAQGGTWTQFRIPDGLINPLATPCFWGLIFFIIALVWTAKLRANYNAVSQFRLIWLLVAGTMFGWGNYSYTLAKLYTSEACDLGCSAGYFGIPQFTTCLVGAVVFTLALIAAVRLYRAR